LSITSMWVIPLTLMKVTAPPCAIVTEAGLKVSLLVAFTAADVTPVVAVGITAGVGVGVAI
jgi:hypothetical protein